MFMATMCANVMPRQLLQEVVVEVRQNLRCANVFLQFNNPVDKYSTLGNNYLKLHINSNILHVQHAFQAQKFVVQLPFECGAANTVDDVRGDASITLENLLVDESNISFRLSAIEMKATNIIDGNSKMAKQLQVTPGKGDHVAVNNDIVDITTIIICGNCKSQISGEHVYSRILEFPSDDINAADFFCHLHSHDNGNETAVKSMNHAKTLVPLLTDKFYGFGFIVLNRENLSESEVNVELSHVYCRCCMQHLGETLFDGKAVKLWTDMLWQQNITSGANRFISQPFPTKTTPQTLLLKIIKDASLTLENSDLMQFTKVVIRSTFANRQTNFLLLHLIEKDLTTFRNNSVISGNKNNSNDNCYLTVPLTNCKCIKLYFRCIDDDFRSDDSFKSKGGKGTNNNADDELNAWMSDLSIHNLKISPKLFRALFKELTVNSLLLPRIYRHSVYNKVLSLVFY